LFLPLEGVLVARQVAVTLNQAFIESYMFAGTGNFRVSLQEYRPEQ
jgi:hypothetical protein